LFFLLQILKENDKLHEKVAELRQLFLEIMERTKNGNKPKYVKSILKLKLKLKNDLKCEELKRQVTELQEELEKNWLKNRHLENKLQMDQEVGNFFHII
jgi:hypothetical protein